MTIHEYADAVSYIKLINGRPCPIEDDDFYLEEGNWVAIGKRRFESVEPYYRPGAESFTHEVQSFRPLGQGGKPPKFFCLPIKYQASHRDETWDIMVVADEPFALINFSSFGDESCQIAKEIFQGEPRRLPQIKHPQFQKGAKGWRWIKLTDLAAFMGQDARHIWLTYGRAAMSESQRPTLDRKYGSEKVLLVTLDSCASELLVAQGPGAVESSLLTVKEWRRFHYTIGDEYLWVDEVYDRMFVPAGWAMNVLYLHWLDYQRFNVFDGEGEIDEALKAVDFLVQNKVDLDGLAKFNQIVTEEARRHPVSSRPYFEKFPDTLDW